MDNIVGMRVEVLSPAQKQLRQPEWRSGCVWEEDELDPVAHDQVDLALGCEYGHTLIRLYLKRQEFVQIGRRSAVEDLGKMNDSVN